jgi:hypothetical protein
MAMYLRFFTLLLGFVLMTACNSNDEAPTAPLGSGSIDKINNLNPGEIFCVDLIAGQNTVVGTVCFEEVNLLFGDAYDDHLRVTFTTTGGWEMSEVHLYIGMDIPSSAAPGQFPFVFDGWTSTKTSFTFDIPYSFLESLSGDLYSCYKVMAHAAVENSALAQSETAWGEGGKTGHTAWSMAFDICLSEDNGGGGVGGGDPLIETAYAFNSAYSTCFIPTFGNWGWTNEVTAGTLYTFDLIAAAGQCDISAGIDVGSVTLEITGTSAEVTYTMTPPFVLEEVHFYIGTTEFPQVKTGKKWVSTVAPGQYPFVYDAGPYTSPATFTVTVPAGSSYFIAHAVVAEF